MAEQIRYNLADYFATTAVVRVFNITAVPSFSPLDVNVAFLLEGGWNQAVDRLRFHTAMPAGPQPPHPFVKEIHNLGPRLLIRRLDHDEDCLVNVTIDAEGEVSVLSNDAECARKSFDGIFLNCPPSFHGNNEFEITEKWLDDARTKALFCGLLTGARGWDPSVNVPTNIRHSLEEAHRSMDIANYRSTVVMARRTLEGVLKFGFERLLKRPPLQNNGQPMTLNDMIRQFRNEPTRPIPEYLLHIADSLRLLGNVPGAHAAEIPNYQFTRSDAEYALYAVSHFLSQYFSKIDQEVSEYYEVEIDLSVPPGAGGSAAGPS
jgi:hypothetical protein